MFGGYGGGGAGGTLLNETWSWNGSTLNWTQVATPNTSGGVPGARIDHAMAASATQVIMFGGRTNQYQSNSTWSFSGGAWSEITPTTKPSVRSGHAMSYDATNNIWVMFGGKNEYNYLPETWTFSGTNWTQVATGNGVGPGGLVGHQMAWDAASGRTILSGSRLRSHCSPAY